ncbi:hypothetical protein [Sinanaerobacter chloroacetimidivorans]|uniref:Uncharacterized protein n=1 Tax=Sinanaerobacter chloroacetimidivorans TaxID=2818044 RepID=A0A8J7W3M7_9FIRM|nr:hypothetical protein [Sinanaerobacter chloroacetimidivorans]MBR0598325.1 hypothetical protein [Sinanaerobacter chloroacetimidivorans]
MINFVILFVLVICFIVMGLAIFLMSREKQRKNYTVKFIMITIFIFLGIIIYLFFYINPQVNIQEVYFDESRIVNNEVIIHGIFRSDWDSYYNYKYEIEGDSLILTIYKYNFFRKALFRIHALGIVDIKIKEVYDINQIYIKYHDEKELLWHKN